MNEQSAEKSSTAYEMWMLICLLILIKWFIFLFAYIRKLCKPYQEFCWGPSADQANKTPVRTEERTENEVEFQTLLLHKQYKNKCMPGMTPLASVPLRAKPEPEVTALCVTAACSFATPGVTQGCYLFGWALLLSQPSSTAQGSNSTYLNGNKVSIQLCCCCASQHI